MIASSRNKVQKNIPAPHLLTFQESSSEWPLKFKILAEDGYSRAAEMTLPHVIAETPMYMPVGTKGTIKGLPAQEVTDIGYKVILGNTYHLWHSPGPKALEEFGGLHNFSRWPRGMLTDSGGFQIVSLHGKIVEQGVWFDSPLDGKRKLLTPEESIQIQNSIGADIIVQLDDVVPPTSDRESIKSAMERTIRWVDRCIVAHKRRNDQNLFAIVQGGLHEDLRTICAKELSKRNLPGYCIGGLSGGEDKDLFWRAVFTATQNLPKNKPRYLMGVGFPVDLVVCSCLGVDMFDCVYATRTARFGRALYPHGAVHVDSSRVSNQNIPIDSDCECSTCQNYSRSYLHYLFHKSPSISASLITTHNLYYLYHLMDGFREAVIKGEKQRYVQDFLFKLYPNGIKGDGFAGSGSKTAKSDETTIIEEEEEEEEFPAKTESAGSKSDDPLYIPTWVVNALTAAKVMPFPE